MKTERPKNRWVRRHLMGELLESRHLLSAVGFVTQEIVESDALWAEAVYAVDVDGDGDVDVLSASGFRIGWYENVDGQGTFSPQKLVTSEVFDAKSLYAADVDGDGDVDVLVGSVGDGQTAWYENIDGRGTFGRRRDIGDQADFIRSVFAADLDGDGDLEVLSAAGANIAWYENTDGEGSFGPQQVIATEASARSVYAADVDGDGDVDVLSAGFAAIPEEEHKIAWYENTDGEGTFGPQQVISTKAAGANSVYAADVDGDGDVDVLSAASDFFSDSNRIAWYENTDGQGTFGPQQVISTEAAGAQSVYAADVDGDGDVDVLSASGSDNKIAWYENADGQGTFGPQQVISTEAAGAQSAYAADVDGDGDVDVLSASGSDNKIAWYENTDGEGTFGEQTVLSKSSPAQAATSVYAADVDGDGDMDVLSASERDDKIAWYENADGQGTFGPQQVISTEAAGAQSVYAVDLDGDGDVDVLSASSDKRERKIAWYENADGQGTFGPQQVISTKAAGANSVYAADVDGDGDVDVLSASWRDDKIAWYENADGQGTFGPQQVISTDTDLAGSVYAADVDGDGDVDVLSASGGDHNKVAWYENIDGAGTFGPQHVISTETAGAQLVYAADVDGDGDVDVLSVSGGDDKVAWYENTDGKGTFGPQQVITTEAHWARSVHAADVDGDGDADVLSASGGDDKIAWYENRLAGDADDDGEVAFADFLALANNFGHTKAVWEDGDFDGDGRVSFSDFGILADNFGQSRRPFVASTSQAAETVPRATISAADDLFERFADELAIDKVRYGPSSGT